MELPGRLFKVLYVFCLLFSGLVKGQKKDATAPLGIEGKMVGRVDDRLNFSFMHEKVSAAVDVRLPRGHSECDVDLPMAFMSFLIQMFSKSLPIV